MNSKSTRTTQHSMHSMHSRSRRLVRLVAGATLAVSALTIATPAMAQLPPNPEGRSGGCLDWSPVVPDQPPRGSHAPIDCQVPSVSPLPDSSTLPPASAVVSDPIDLSSATLGALAGIALGGAGLGITLGIQRRRDRST